MKKSIRFFSTSLFSYALYLVFFAPGNPELELHSIHPQKIYHYPPDELIYKLIAPVQPELDKLQMKTQPTRVSED